MKVEPSSSNSLSSSTNSIDISECYDDVEESTYGNSFDVKEIGNATLGKQLLVILRISFLQRVRSPSKYKEILLPCLFLIFMCIFASMINYQSDEIKNTVRDDYIPFPAIGGTAPNFGMIPKNSYSERFIDVLNEKSPMPFKENVTFFSSFEEYKHFIHENREVEDRFYAAEWNPDQSNLSNSEIKISSNGMTLDTMPILIQNIASTLLNITKLIDIPIFVNYKKFPQKSTFSLDIDGNFDVSIFSTVQPFGAILTTGLYFGSEAESGLRDLLTFYGLCCTANEIRWFILCFVTIFVTSIPYALALTFILSINFGLIIVYYILSAAALTSFTLFLLSLWPTAKMGNIVGYGILISFFILFFLAAFTWLFEEGNYEAKYLLSIFPHACTAYTLAQISCGATRSFKEINGSKFYPVKNGFIMLGCEAIVYYILFVIVERLKPRKWFPAPIKWKYSKKIESSLEEFPIHVSGLYKSFYSKETKKTTVAVNDLSFNVSMGEKIAIVGPNGAGKSTTMNILSGTSVPDKGEIRFQNVDVLKNMLSLHKFVGFCPQENLFMNELTSSEWVQAVCALRNKPTYDFSEIFKVLGLDESKQLKSQIGKMSGGNKRKVCLASALVCDPPIIILDEATSGVDFTSRTRIWSIISSLKKATVIMATHTLEECEKIADRIMVIIDGEISNFASPNDLRNIFKCGYIIETDETNTDQFEKIIDDCKIENNIINKNQIIKKEGKLTLSIPPSKTEVLTYLLDKIRFKYILSIQSLEEQIFMHINEQETIRRQNEIISKDSSDEE